MEKQRKFKLSSWKDISIERLFVLTLCIGLFYRIIRWSIGMPLWGDEAMFALNLPDRSFMELFTPLQMGQIAPPFFIWISWLNINGIGNSELILRFPSTLASIMSLLVMFLFTRKSLEKKEAFLAVSILAVSYYSMRYGAELKPYSIDLLISLIVLFIGYQFRGANTNSVIRLLFIIVLPIVTFLSFPSVLVVASVLSVLIIDRLVANDKKQLITVLLTGAIALGLFLVNYYYFILPHSQPHSAAHAFLKVYWASAFPPNDLLGFFVWLVRESTGKIMAYPVGASGGGSIVTVIFFISGIYVLWKDKRRFLLALLVLPFVFSWLAASFQVYPYGFSARIAQHLAPSICMLAAVGLIYWLARFSETEEKLNNKVKIACIVLCCVGLLGIGYTFSKPYKTKNDLEVRDIVESFFHDYGCQTIFVPNRKENVPANFRWYLTAKRTPSFNSTIEVQYDNKQIGGHGFICIIFFDSKTHTKQARKLNAELLELQRYFKKVLDTENKIESHSYRQIVLSSH